MKGKGGLGGGPYESRPRSSRQRGVKEIRSNCSPLNVVHVKNRRRAKAGTGSLTAGCGGGAVSQAVATKTGLAPVGVSLRLWRARLGEVGALFFSSPGLPDVSCLLGAGAQPDWLPEATTESTVALLPTYGSL